MTPMMRTISAVMLAAMLAAPALASAQGLPPLPRPRRDQRRGPETTEPFSKTVRLGRGATFDLTNVAGDIVITGGGGNDLRIDAVKRVRSKDEADAKAQLQAIEIEIVELSNRVEVRTIYPRLQRRNAIGAVDYTVALPQDANVTVKSVAGNVRVTNVKGELRAESVSGDLTVRGFKGRTLDAASVSGTLRLDNIESERVSVRTVRGDVEYGGMLARNGRYEFTAHSGHIQLNLSGSTGFDVAASTFSGDVRSDYALTLRGNDDRVAPPPLGPGRQNRRVRTLRGSYGDGSASIELQSFSGDIAITRR